MRRWLALALLVVPLAVAAQEERGFFGRMFGRGGDAVQEEQDRGFFGRVFGSGADEQEDSGTFLERRLERALSDAGRDVTVRGFRGALSSRATVTELTIADDQGVWLTMRDVTLDWDRAGLLRRRIDVRELTAGEILLPRLPVAGEPAAGVPSPEAPGFALPELPVAVQVGRVEAGRVELGEPLFGEAAVVSLEGSVSLAGGAGEADISATRIDGEEGALGLQASFDNATTVLSLDLDVSEGADGIVANLIDLPGRPSLQLTASGTGPLDDFTADIGLSTDGEPRLAGTVELGRGEAGGRTFSVALGGDIAPVFLPEYQDFFGSEVRLVASGATVPDGGTRIDALRIEAAALTLEGQASIGADGLPDLIDLSGRIADPGGEPVLLPLSGPPTRVDDVTLRVAFDAAASEGWSLDLTVAGLDREGFDARQVTIAGTGRIAASPARAVTAALDFAADDLSLADSGAQEALGERVNGRAELAWTEGQPLDLSVLTVEGETYALDATGRVTFGEALNVEGQATVSARDLAAFSGLAQRPLAGSAEFSVEGSGDPLAGKFDLTLEGTTEGLAVGVARLDPLLAGAGTMTVRTRRSETGTEIETFRIETPQLAASGEGTLATGSSRVNLTARVEDTSLVAPRMRGPADLTVVAGEVPSGWEFDVDATGAGARVAAEGTADWLGLDPVVDARFDVDAADLAPFSDLAGRELAGRLAAQGQVRTSFDLERASVEATMQGQGLATGDPRVDPLLAGEVDVTADAIRSGDTVLIRSFRLTSPDATVTAAGRVDGLTTVPVFDGDVAVASPDLAAFSSLAGRPLGGAVDAQASGVLAADLSRFDLTVEATADDLVAGDASVQGLAGRTTLSAEASRTGDRVEIVRFELSGPQATASGAGVLSLGARPAFDGRMTLAAPDLAAFSGLAGRQLGGSVDATFEGVVATDLSDIDAVLTGVGRDLDIGLPGGPILPGEATLDIVARREGDAINLSRLTLTSGNLNAEGVGQVRQLAATPVFDGQVSLSAQSIAPFGGLVGRPLAGSLSGGVSGTVAADLSRFNLTADGRAVGLSVGQADLDRLLTGTTTLALDASRGNGITRIRDARVEASGFNVSASGSLGEAGASIRLSARLADIGPYAPDFSGPVTVEGSVVQTNGTLNLNLNGQGPGGIAARVTGSVTPGAQTVALDVTGQAPLAVANRFVQPRALAGTADVALAINGRPSLQAVSGTITTNGARIVDPRFAIVLENVSARAEIASGRVSVAANGSVQAGGSVSVNGSLGIADLAADLDVRLANVVLRDPNLYTTSVSGNIAVNGPLRGGGSISGELALGPTEVRIPQGGVGGGGPIPEITHVNEPVPVRETRIRAGLLRQSMDGTETLTERRRNALGLDIGISAPNRIFVRGRGLDAELGGALRIGGTTVDMVPSGQFDLIRGRLDILGRRLTMSEGSLRLQGDFVPIIRLVAQTTADDVTVQIVVEGPLTQPDFSFTSQPELPEDEVLARLLFGRNIADISPLQAAQLASAVAQLAGRGPGIADRLRQNFGLDDLDLTTSDQGGTAIRAGRYLSENIYTDLAVDSEGETQLNLTFDVSPSFKVRGGVDTRGDTNLGVFFERDY